MTSKSIQKQTNLELKANVYRTHATREEEHEDEEDDDDKELKAGYHKKMENKKLKKEDLEIDVKDDMDALVGGEDLSEEFKTKAATIFETAVSAEVISEVNQRIEELEEQYVQEIYYKYNTQKI